MKASISAAKKAPSASSPTCVPTRPRCRTTRWPRCASTSAKTFGKEFLPESPNTYKTKKNAQEAHEAIRPTLGGAHPDQMKQYLQEDEYKVYKLIWQRFVASQMNPAVFDQTTVDIDAKTKDGRQPVYRFRVTGSVLKFEGFLKVYEESKDSKDEEDEALKHKLPLLVEGQKLR
jgi:DNA topoisomerase I